MINESTDVAVQYFLIHQALGAGSDGTFCSKLPFTHVPFTILPKSSSSFMNPQVSFLHTVQSRGVPLIIAVGATTIPDQKEKLCLDIDKAF